MDVKDEKDDLHIELHFHNVHVGKNCSANKHILNHIRAIGSHDRDIVGFGLFAILEVCRGLDYDGG